MSKTTYERADLLEKQVAELKSTVIRLEGLFRYLESDVEQVSAGLAEIEDNKEEDEQSFL